MLYHEGVPTNFLAIRISSIVIYVVQNYSFAEGTLNSNKEQFV